MANRERNEYRPDYRVHPSETLREMMRERGWTESDLAIKLGMLPSALCDFLDRKVEIVPSFARRLELATGASARLWLSLQRDYDYDKGVSHD